jgi:hypothetical protein
VETTVLVVALLIHNQIITSSTEKNENTNLNKPFVMKMVTTDDRETTIGRSTYR